MPATTKTSHRVSQPVSTLAAFTVTHACDNAGEDCRAIRARDLGADGEGETRSALFVGDKELVPVRSDGPVPAVCRLHSANANWPDVDQLLTQLGVAGDGL